MNKLEEKPTYRFFGQFKRKGMHDLKSIKLRLSYRGYKSVEEWVGDLTEFFQRIINQKNAVILVKQIGGYTLDWVLRKIAKFRVLEKNAWKERFCEVYQEVSEQVAKCPLSLDIARKSAPMQMVGTGIDITETEMLVMRKAIDELSPEESEIISNLVIAMEPEAVRRGESIVFDVSRLSRETLLALRKFLRQRELKLNKGKQSAVNLF